MKTVAVTELLLVCALLAVAYLVWMQQAQLADLEISMDTVRRQIGDLTKPPAAKPRARKPKETTP